MFKERNRHPVADLLSWYLNGTLSEGEREKVQVHLTDCADCRSELHAMQQLQGAMRKDSAHSVEPSPNVFRRVMNRIRKKA